MDIADVAQQNEEITQRVNLEQSRRYTADAVATGQCLNCEEPLPAGMRWCGAECRDDWQRDNE
jgi:hypothetical protein